MFDSGLSSALVQLKYQNAAAPIINRGLKNQINSSDFRDLYANALEAKQSQALASIARMAMQSSSLGMIDGGSGAAGSGFNSSILSSMLRSALQSASYSSPSNQTRAANFASQTQSTKTTTASNASASSSSETAAQKTASPAPAEGEYESLIQSAAQRHWVDPSLVKAVITAESDFNPQVVSQAGAMGLMQLMPGTAKDMGVSDPFDPTQNIEGGVKYLAKMLKRFDGDESKALAAYNWGPGNVEGGGRYPAETRRYLKKVAAFKGMYGDGFTASA